MTPEFDQLSEKIRMLAEMAQKLRLENADLRLQMAALSADNTRLDERMREAKLRVSALIETIPAAEEVEVGE